MDDEGWPTNDDEEKDVIPSTNTKLDEQTTILETNLLAEKPWQLTGEVKSTSRPTNSLLSIIDNPSETKLQFEMAQ